MCPLVGKILGQKWIEYRNFLNVQTRPAQCPVAEETYGRTFCKIDLVNILSNPHIHWLIRICQAPKPHTSIWKPVCIFTISRNEEYIYHLQIWGIWTWICSDWENHKSTTKCITTTISTVKMCPLCAQTRIQNMKNETRDENHEVWIIKHKV